MTAGSYSIPEVKRLLATLVAAKPGGRVAEAGSSWGEGAEAIAAALGPGATFVTCEADPERAAAARERLAGLPVPVEALEGRWQDVLPPRAPFDLLFFDSGGIGEEAVDLLAPGGILVKDDLTPGRPVDGDPVRELLLRNPRLEAVELRTTADAAAIVAVRRA